MEKPRTVFLDTHTVGKPENVRRLTEMTDIVFYPETEPEQTIERIGNAEIVITNKVVISSSVMDSCPGLKLVCIAATGMNNIDIAHAASRNIQVKNVRGYSTESVVQVTFSLLFYLIHHTRYYDDYTKSGEYAQNRFFTHFDRNFHELSGKYYGIIGMGTIGKRVAEAARAFGARVVYHSTTGRNLHNPYPHMSLDELLGISDVVSIHCPLTPATENLIGYEQLKAMKPSAILINTGRGGVVNEVGLARALDERLIAAAGLDVLEREPPLPSNPLFALEHPDRILVTPHLAWASDESRERLIEGIIQNITDYINEKGRKSYHP
jgi:glycerate dehydrogenase